MTFLVAWIDHYAMRSNIVIISWIAVEESIEVAFFLFFQLSTSEIDADSRAAKDRMLAFYITLAILR